jgi:hypothetical protein
MHQLPAGWVEVSRWCLRSPCGDYTVCKIGLAEGWRYELWKGKSQIVVGMSTAADAIREYNRLITSSSSVEAVGPKSLQPAAGDPAGQLSFLEAS